MEDIINELKNLVELRHILNPQPHEYQQKLRSLLSNFVQINNTHPFETRLLNLKLITQLSGVREVLIILNREAKDRIDAGHDFDTGICDMDVADRAGVDVDDNENLLIPVEDVGEVLDVNEGDTQECEVGTTDPILDINNYDEPEHRVNSPENSPVRDPSTDKGLVLATKMTKRKNSIDDILGLFQQEGLPKNMVDETWPKDTSILDDILPLGVYIFEKEPSCEWDQFYYKILTMDAIDMKIENKLVQNGIVVIFQKNSNTTLSRYLLYEEVKNRNQIYVIYSKFAEISVLASSPYKKITTITPEPQIVIVDDKVDKPEGVEKDKLRKSKRKRYTKRDASRKKRKLVYSSSSSTSEDDIFIRPKPPRGYKIRSFIEKFKIGTKVPVYFDNVNSWYKGSIEDVFGNGKEYYIEYEDGDTMKDKLEKLKDVALKID
eukprot:TRINITY_DN1744_c0_g3_i1.p1 TRINITY_DN1744_c0_g3~~TRINITY_DN1744_c0_g3_i1.p1  ORF type:complete len:434 (+),score=110.09 TRINITY_DN1744_c0_g3_i1:61-1362(+)